MKLSTLASKMKLLSVNSNAKTSKSDSEFPDTLTAILYLAPHTLAGHGNVCAHATEGCKATCLYSAGRGAMNSVQQARIKKTKLFFENNVSFMETIKNDLVLFEKYCTDNNLKGFVRLNGTSDIDWQKLKYKDTSLNVFEIFKNLNFYDYTKDYKRVSSHVNYSLTFSWNEKITRQQVKQKLKENVNVAVVFDEVPEKWNTFTVINGDVSDLRPMDKKNVIVGLKAKGKARTITTDFVIKTVNI